MEVQTPENEMLSQVEGKSPKEQSSQIDRQENGFLLH